MAQADTRALIEQAVERLGAEVPSLKQLKLIVRLELATHGDAAPVWRVEVPGPKVTKQPPADARVEVTIPRSHFNELAKDGRLKNWVDAYENGHIRVSGEPAVVKLVAAVIERQLARARA